MPMYLSLKKKIENKKSEIEEILSHSHASLDDKKRDIHGLYKHVFFIFEVSQKQKIILQIFLL